MSEWASLLDVRNRYEQTITDALEGTVATKLDDAEALVAARFRRIGLADIAAAIAANRTTAQDVKIVLCNMVMRWLRNPSGMQQETTGPYSYTRNAQVASGRLFIDPDDRQLLGLPQGAVSLQLQDDALRHPTRRPGPRDWWVGNRRHSGEDC
ncbi:Gp19/Gp15/Gp42 family protein [Amycolatopsis sp. NPDC004368]